MASGPPSRPRPTRRIQTDAPLQRFANSFCRWIAASATGFWIVRQISREHLGIVREFSAKQLDLPAFPFPGEIVLLDPETIRSDRPVFQCETRLRNERLERVKK